MIFKESKDNVASVVELCYIVTLCVLVYRRLMYSYPNDEYSKGRRIESWEPKLLRAIDEILQCMGEDLSATEKIIKQHILQVQTGVVKLQPEPFIHHWRERRRDILRENEL